MHLFLITFADGRTLIEYGNDEQDVRNFLKRSYSSWGLVSSVVQTTSAWVD